MNDLLDKEDTDDGGVVDMMCTSEAAISRQTDNDEKGDDFQDAMDSLLQGTDDKWYEDVEPDLTKTLDEVGDAMYAILKENINN
ncbi:unnamed protein product [Lactuca saligna]|uniref:Uncharacterized protein n=1 Tax=Lactuca saligna TaxID=75948 RepID=A0AA35YKI6_LACSI|nr:unnamed protein product [Lactuca saligna]